MNRFLGMSVAVAVEVEGSAADAAIGTSRISTANSLMSEYGGMQDHAFRAVMKVK